MLVMTSANFKQSHGGWHCLIATTAESNSAYARESHADPRVAESATRDIFDLPKLGEI
jgi:hypothetical protein